MKIISFQKSKSLRKSRNQEILWRMENGESLTSFNSYSSWFPPRPVLEKDPNAVMQLYGTKPDERLEKAAKLTSQNNDSDQNPMTLKIAQ